MVWPLYWSGNVWATIHFIALSYPSSADSDRKLATHNMLRGLFMNLPCPACAHHATQYLESNPPCLDTRESFVTWTVMFHNSVNERTGKRSDWTVKEATDEIVRKYMQDGNELSRAEQKRKEDHLHIAMLKQQNTPTKVMNATLGICIFSLILMFILLCKKRK